MGVYHSTWHSIGAAEVRRIAPLLVRVAFAPALTLLVAALPASAQMLVQSEKIDAISVTLYRDPGRSQGAADGNWPGGYALITETRTITLPAGRSTIRFEGVSEGMMPETAIVTGLPRRVNEKNRDARLLGPATLVDAYLKRRVTIRRTDRATGKTTIGEAVIQAGPNRGVVLTTAEGIEALGCSGLPEALSYPGVPEDLAAKPTLSVVTDTVTAATATIQLSYLAQGFDWSAHYVARVADDGDTLDLFAWLTVVNGGSQGFAAANTNAVAGAPNKEANQPLPKGPEPALHLSCWPMDNTSTHPGWGIDPPARPEPVPVAMMAYGADIIVTAQRRSGLMAESAVPVTVIMAKQEELGDLKLYRIPEPVTVAAMSRKQVAMIDRKRFGSTVSIPARSRHSTMTRMATGPKAKRQRESCAPRISRPRAWACHCPRAELRCSNGPAATRCWSARATWPTARSATRWNSAPARAAMYATGSSPSAHPSGANPIASALPMHGRRRKRSN
ncbi:DUF4139 domain-containing protein [Sphingomonas alpina]|uniref:DUF4139 domain-containing protein n=1 Tax=Sphingomonas alpina TaxID=653931 RepID=UPI001E4AB0C6|nr:hypothetical protein [Sphingomonas alpina]